MKKKGLAVFMAMVLSGISLCGCGGDGGNAASNINVGGSDNDMAGGQMEGMTSETFNGDGGLSYDASGDMDLFGEIPAEAPGVEWNTEEYNSIREMGFQSVANAPLSTFSADVDTASYSNLRRMIEQGCSMEQIPAGAVRIEELLNYFSYDYNLPKGKEPFGVTAVMGDCPWNSDARLLQIGLKTEEIDFGEAPDSNLVFLLDVSGSMYSQEKLPLLQRSFGLLAEELTEKDKVSIITYAGSDTIVLEGVSGDEKEKIREALDSLEASGSTNGAGAIESAYRLAEQYFIETTGSFWPQTEI